MGASKSSFTFTVTPEQGETLRRLLEARGWQFSDLPYAHWRAAGDRVNIAYYNSGKLTVQGSGAEDFARFTLEPDILHTFTFDYPDDGGVKSAAAGAPPADETSPHGGVDESGKGDFFGPLCVAAVYADTRTAPLLRTAGCCDSKLIKSDARIRAIAAEIRKIAGRGVAVLTLRPETYNSLYSRIGNLNRLLAWGHARVIENLLGQGPDCPRVVSDKFGNEILIRRALMERGRKIKTEQRVRGESDVAVAAASIIAREAFLTGMEELTGPAGMELPRGAGAPVRVAAETLLAAKGKEIFAKCAKLHFRTYAEITGEGGN